MDMTEFYGEPISVYTDEQAIEDGCLVVVDEERFPNCLFTRAVHAVIMEKVGYLSRRDGITQKRAYLQIAMPLMMDVVMVARKNPGKSLYTGDDLNGNVTGKKLSLAMNGLGGITVMFPEDR